MLWATDQLRKIRLHRTKKISIFKFHLPSQFIVVEPNNQFILSPHCSYPLCRRCDFMSWSMGNATGCINSNGCSVCLFCYSYPFKQDNIMQTITRNLNHGKWNYITLIDAILWSQIYLFIFRIYYLLNRYGSFLSVHRGQFKDFVQTSAKVEKKNKQIDKTTKKINKQLSKVREPVTNLVLFHLHTM